MTNPYPMTPPRRERLFVMAYGQCRIWRLLEGPNRGEYVVSAKDPPFQERTVATLPAAHRACLALERQQPNDAA
jgi:hypothetical protein